MTAPTYRLFVAPRRRRIRPLWWDWALTDGIGGPTLAAGHALTSWGVTRKQARAERQCVPFQVVRIEHPPIHPLTLGEAATVSRQLRAEGVQVYVRPSGMTVVLCPLAKLTTWEQVHAIRVVQQVTDAPVRWSEAVA